MIELGSGTGEKTRAILTALRSDRSKVRYFPIDVSPKALARCQRDLADVSEIHPLELSYLDGMAEAAAARPAGQPLLVLFLGSTIGNFERGPGADFLREIRELLKPDDSLLLGTDLVKPVSQILPAYDDPTGVTAAFNLNLLARINRSISGFIRCRGGWSESFPGWPKKPATRRC